MAKITSTAARFSIYVGRIFLTLAFLALIQAWIAQATGGTIFGLSQQHLFNDAIALALLGIGSFLDGLWHARN